jgi:type I restriction enzyme S subunit
MGYELTGKTLADLCLMIVDCPHATPKWTETGFLVLRNQNIKGGRLDLSAPSFTDEQNYLGRIKRAAPEYGDIVITREAPMGEVCLIPAGIKCCLGQRQVLLKPNLNKVTSEYLLYVLQSEYVQNQIGWNEGTGSTVSNIRIPVLAALVVPVPSIATQSIVAGLLSALDKRIDLLKETNKTLEAIAQTTFKSWFVDFGPVHAKQQGVECAGIDKATADLFPSSFVQSELGLIPEGWRVGSIYDTAEIIYGAAFSSKLFNGDRNGIPVLRIRDLKDENPNIYTTENHPKGYLLQHGDIVVGMDGEFRAYLWGGDSAWLNQRVCVFKPKPNVCSAYLHLTIKPLLALVEASETATTVIHIGKNDFDRFKTLLPADSVLKMYSALVNPIYKAIVNNKQTAKTLALLRDTLLPRLMSGKINLREIEEQLEGVA